MNAKYALWSVWKAHGSLSFGQLARRENSFRERETQLLNELGFPPGYTSNITRHAVMQALRRHRPEMRCWLNRDGMEGVRTRLERLCFVTERDVEKLFEFAMPDDVREITRANLMGFRQRLVIGDELEYSTINTYVKCIHRMLDSAVRHGVLDTAPILDPLPE